MATHHHKNILTQGQLESTKLGPLRAIRPDGDTSEVQFSNFTVNMVSGVSTRVRVFQSNLANPPEIEHETAPEDVPHSPISPTARGSDLDAVSFDQIVVNVGGKTFNFYPTPTGGPDPRGGVPVNLSKGLETLLTIKPGTIVSGPMGPGFTLTITQADPPTAPPAS